LVCSAQRWFACKTTVGLLDSRQEQIAFLVSADLERAVRANVTARKSQIDAIDRRAREAGMTRSAYMVLSALGRDLGKTRSGQKRIARD
jgi:hypothetical protein